MPPAKRQKSVIRVGPATVDDVPLTRSKTLAQRSEAAAVSTADPKSEVDAAAEALLPWCADAEFQEQHLAALYRTAMGDPGRQTPGVADKGDNPATGDCVAEAIDLPSPFVSVSVSDKKGTWQNEPPIKKQLGEDPVAQFRATWCPQHRGVFRRAVAPAGLRNLGATCYLNSLLQYLFFNADFRESLLKAQSESAVVQELQKIFALLAIGKRNVVDPSGFVQATGVDAVEQEDATEFSTLLLDWLERALGKGCQDIEKGGGFIPALFQGEVTQIVTCLENDHSFERREPFYELRARLTINSGNPASVDKADSAVLRRTHSATATVEAPTSTVVEFPAATTAAADYSLGTAGGAEGASASAASATAKKNQGGGKKKAAAPLVFLEELLAETAFPDEFLQGSEKYHCSKCDKKVVARKSIRLANPPPYLNITVERYHYDLQKGVRKKLNNPVSFPQNLRLRVCKSKDSEADTVVTYECVGFLEHVSDSAHSGHYTATLYQEDDDAIAALTLAADSDEAARKTAVHGDTAHREEPSTKKRRCDTADAAAGEPRDGLWWTLDDLTVSPVCWKNGRAEVAKQVAEGTAGEEECAAPDRIESTSAYLLLYRQFSPRRHNDRSPVHRLVFPAIATMVATDNETLSNELREYQKKAAAVSSFLLERRLAVDNFIQAVRNTPLLDLSCAALDNPGSSVLQGLPPLVVVPTQWLASFLHGEDRTMEDLVNGRFYPEAVTYRRALLRLPGNLHKHVLDPLSVWCGDVKLVPKSAFEKLPALDISQFLTLTDVADAEACKAAWALHRVFKDEWTLLRRVLPDAKVNLAEAKQMFAEGRGDDVAWVSNRVQRYWHKMANPIGAAGAAKSQIPSDLLALRAFLREAQAARGGNKLAVEVASGNADPLERCELTLTDGIICEHGIVANTRAACLVRRAVVEQLLEASERKAKAYAALWPCARAFPRVRVGPAGILSFGSVCTSCRDACAIGATPGRAQRRLSIKRRYNPKMTRKVGQIVVPESDDPITGNLLRDLIKDQLKLPVATLLVEISGEEAELGKTEVINDSVHTLIMEKDETEAREATAFQGSIFRGGSAVAS